MQVQGPLPPLVNDKMRGKLGRGKGKATWTILRPIQENMLKRRSSATAGSLGVESEVVMERILGRASPIVINL